MKTCTKCGETKTRDEFSKHKRYTDGLQRKCRACDARYKRENAARIAEYDARYKRENAAHIAERDAQYRRDNAERVADRTAQWRRANAERESARKAQWRRDNPDKVAAGNARRRAMKNNAHHVPYSRTEIFERWGNLCCYCPAPAEHLDHVQPLSRGGADADWNLVPACAPCNLSKHAKTLAEWAARF